MMKDGKFAVRRRVHTVTRSKAREWGSVVRGRERERDVRCQITWPLTQPSYTPFCCPSFLTSAEGKWHGIPPNQPPPPI
jgi:hypothetical protein